MCVMFNTCFVVYRPEKSERGSYAYAPLLKTKINLPRTNGEEFHLQHVYHRLGVVIVALHKYIVVVGEVLHIERPLLRNASGVFTVRDAQIDPKIALELWIVSLVVVIHGLAV